MSKLRNRLNRAKEMLKKRGLGFLFNWIFSPLRKKMVIWLYKNNATADLANALCSVKQLQLEITSRCNFRCIMCDQAYRCIKGKDLNLSDFETILDKLPGITTLCPQGLGEPLLNPDFMAMLELAKKRAIYTYVNTNFGLFTENIAKELARLADSVTISFSAGTKETYELIHKGSSFEKTIKNIKIFMRAKKELGHKDPEVELKFVIMSKNINELGDFIKIADELGIRRVFIDDLIPLKEIKHLKVDNEESVKAIEKVKKIAEEKNVKINFDLRRQSLSVNKCTWPIDNVFIDVEGNVYPCCNIGVFFAEGDSREKFSFGNILKQDANEIWKGKQYHQLRKMMMRNKTPAVCKMANCLYVHSSEEK